MTTKLIVVRHGEARGNVDRVFHGFTDSDLTENGRAQIERAVKRLENEKIDAFYSSDLKRAYETAKAIADPRGMAVQTDKRFREIHGGLWENVPWDELPRLFPESGRDWVEKPYALKMPQGETMVEFFERIRAGLEEVLESHKGETICIATHGTVIRVMVCYFKGKPLEALNEIDWCDNAALTVSEYDGTGYTVLIEGENSYLSELSTIAKQNWWKR